MSRAKIKTPAEMELIRAADAKVQEQLRRDFKPEPVRFEDKASIVVSRCTAGSQGWVGLFRAEQLIHADEAGKPLKKPLRLKIADGVDMVVLMSAIETAIRRRCFR